MPAFGPFSGRAAYPAYQPAVDALIRFCIEQHISANELSKRVYGLKPDGSNVNTTTLYKLMHGTQGLSTQTAELVRQKTGLDLSAHVVTASDVKREQLPAVVPARKLKPSARRAVEAYQAQVKEPPRVAVKAPPRFALVVQQDGTASLTMNLLDVDGDTALRAFDVMKVAGLLKGGG